MFVRKVEMRALQVVILGTTDRSSSCSSSIPGCATDRLARFSRLANAQLLAPSSGTSERHADAGSVIFKHLYCLLHAICLIVWGLPWRPAVIQQLDGDSHDLCFIISFLHLVCLSRGLALHLLAARHRLRNFTLLHAFVYLSCLIVLLIALVNPGIPRVSDKSEVETFISFLQWYYVVYSFSYAHLSAYVIDGPNGRQRVVEWLKYLA